PSYFARSCGGAPLHIVKDNIADQKRPDQARLPPCPEGQGFRPRSPMTAAAAQSGPADTVRKSDISRVPRSLFGTTR
ncbi:MAG TPA: hypothetical protein VFE92_16070, partial [Dermatophilaceae bacterium]|nr:hypothetical protein [Dermatophilaceae bacterium]